MTITKFAAMALLVGAMAAPAAANPTDSIEESSIVTSDAPLTPPIAEKRDHSFTHHGITISDPYHWLRDPSYPKVDDAEILAHLEAENAFFEQEMAPRQELVETLFQEMKGRIKEDDSTVPQKDGDWLYWSEISEGQQYYRQYRRAVAGGDAQLLLDENELAAEHEYFRLGAFSVSKNGRYLAYSTDVTGGERYTVRIKDLETGAILPDIIEGTLSGISWVADDTAFVYGPANENWRVDHIKLHRLGDDPADDVELYRESEDGFTISKGLSAQENWLVVTTGNHDTQEVRLIPADDPLAEPILVKPRQAGVEYSVDVRDGALFVYTNDDHVNFRLATAPLENPGEWTTLITGSDEFYLTGFELFEDFFVTEGRLDGLDQVQLRSYTDPAQVAQIEFPEASYSAGLSNNPEYAVDKLRLSYTSMVTPDSVYDYHVGSSELELLKQREIPSGYDASQYMTERLMITARDGTKVPVSLMMRKDRDTLNGGPSGPLYMTAYGSYGMATQPYFSTARLSLLDRGMAFAIAHVRGGDELGKRWHDQGKLFERTHTFSDFVDVAKGLSERGYTQEGKIAASGGSAGGTLMGAIVNTDPGLWGAVVADVPFVDVLGTMLDKDLPLTPGEWPEWGNPIASKRAFAYILSYSPYDQVTAQDYPPMLVLAGLNDPRVTYWEPAKWVARLRELKTDDNELLFKTNMGAGHGGKSGRYDYLREVAEQHAFALWQFGIEQ